MKRLLLALLTLIILLLVGGALFVRFGLGVALPTPGAVFDVAGGMAAKLGCSGRYITGLNEQQVKSDLASYSGLYSLVSITNDDTLYRVTARLAPGKRHSASYRPGIGCSLDIGDTSNLDALDPGSWPVVASDEGLGANPNSGAVDKLLATQLAADNAKGLQTRALLVMHNSQVIGEANAPGFDSTSRHLGWSMGKSLVAMLFGRLEQKTNLNVAQTKLFDEWQDERSTISLKALLNMSSGLQFDEVYAPGSDATRMLFNEHSASAVPLEKPLAHPTGSHFAYSSGTTNLLSRFLVERLGGTDAAYRFLHEELLAPLKLAHTVVEPDPSGVFVGSSYVYASARDWGQLGMLLAADGIYNNQRLLSSDWIKRATTPNSSGNEPRYGYQLWLNRGGDELRWPDLPEDAFAMQGNRAQIVLMIPSRGLVIVRLGWTAGGYPYNDTFAALLPELP